MYSNTLSLAAACVVILFALPTSAAWAETVAFQNGTPNALVANYGGGHDTTLLSGSNTARNSNYGGFNAMFVGHNRRTLLRFDLSSLAGRFASIESATLTLTALVDINGGSFSLFAIDDANAGWQQGTSGGKGELGQANADESTWNHLNDPATTWAGGAGLVAGSDYDAAAVGTITPENIKAGDTFDVAIPATLIERWINQTNAGLFIRADTEKGSPLLQIRSSETSAAGDRPKLTIQYTAAESPS